MKTNIQPINYNVKTQEASETDRLLSSRSSDTTEESEKLNNIIQCFIDGGIILDDNHPSVNGKNCAGDHSTLSTEEETDGNCTIL